MLGHLEITVLCGESTYDVAFGGVEGYEGAESAL